MATDFKDHLLGVSEEIRKPNFPFDLRASLVLFLVSLPICLGVALAQGVPLISGLISGVIGGIIVGIISGSQIAVSGPSAGMTSVVLAGVLAINDYRMFLVAVILGGLIQITFSRMRMGQMASFIPVSVIQGMLAGIGIIIIVKQIPHLAGYANLAEPNMTEGLRGMWAELEHVWNSLHTGAFIAGLFSLIILFTWPLIRKRSKVTAQLPGALIAVASGLIINLIFENFAPAYYIDHARLVNLPDFTGEAGFSSIITFPDVNGLLNVDVWKYAVIFALVSTVETLLCVEAMDMLDPDKRRTPRNRELYAQGIGSTLSGLIGGVPVAAVISRSSVNLYANNKTKASTILHGGWLLIAFILIPGFIELFPLSVLAAVLIYAGYNLADPKNFRKFYSQGLDQFVPFLTTIAFMLQFNLLTGVLAGIAAALAFAVFRLATEPFVLIMEEKDGKNHYTIRLTETITFLSKNQFNQMFQSIPEGSVVHIEVTHLIFIDKEIIQIIRHFIRTSKDRGIHATLHLGKTHRKRLMRGFFFFRRRKTPVEKL